jgi:DNA ligase D-like protein (predicted ligase)
MTAIKNAGSEWFPPMLAKLVTVAPPGPGWLVERKLDGERCLTFRDGKAVKIMTRNRLSANDYYPDLLEALAAQPHRRFVVDGEVVAFDKAATSFSRLQARMHVSRPDAALISRVPVYYYLFDLLYLDGQDLRARPLLERKQLLKEEFVFSDPLRWTAHHKGSIDRRHREACAAGWEGVIAKQESSPYVSRRSEDWRKLKCLNSEEFVVGGYTDPRGARAGFGALMLGYYVDGDLVYVGKVGTGFSEATIQKVYKSLRSKDRQTPPFQRGDFEERGVHWVRPELVVQVGFAEITPDGRLRQPRFLGIRRDKTAKEVGAIK